MSKRCSCHSTANLLVSLAPHCIVCEAWVLSQVTPRHIFTSMIGVVGVAPNVYQGLAITLEKHFPLLGKLYIQC